MGPESLEETQIRSILDAWLLQRVGSRPESFSDRGRTYLVVQVFLGLEGQALVILQSEHVGPDADG